MVIKTETGERIKRWFYRFFSQSCFLGIKFQAVLFADHRSGWAALQVTFGFILWQWACCPLWWRPAPPERYQWRTLADQIKETHGMEAKMVEAENESQ